MIKVICVGKLKEKYLIELVSDYSKRINKYHKLQIIEVKDSTIENEAQLILNNLSGKDYIFVLDINGKKFGSIKFKDMLETAFNQGNSNIVFIIGGSLGLSKSVLEKSNVVISFSDLTFPHGLFRGVLLEQIYRAFKIINNESYHK